ncbi:MAG: hypothetical protein ACI85O_002297 [Saprospiraceae bacterium]|jgi:hypothetical protein
MAHVFVPSQEDYDEIKKDLAEVREYLKSIVKPEEKFFSNQEFLKLMQVSKKTAVTWRNDGKIGFTQEGGKIYYRMSDIELFLEKFHKKPFAKPKKSV